MMHLTRTGFLAPVLFLTPTHAFQSGSRYACFLNLPTTPRNSDVIQPRSPPTAHVPPGYGLQPKEFQFQERKYKNVAQKTPRTASVMASSKMDNDEGKGMSLEQKVAGRKKRVILGYKASAVIYLLLGISTFLPGLIKPSMMPLAMNYASGPLMAAGMAYILIGAAENDRLRSDTYKRLNLWLSQFGLLWLIAAILVGQTKPLTRGAKIVSNPLVMFAGLSSLVNGIKGWAYGAKGWDKAGGTTFVEDLKGLAKSSLDVVVSPLQNMKAGTYVAGTAFAVLLKLMKVSELVQMVLGMPAEAVTAAKYGSWFIAFAKLQLLFISTLTLADAAKRDRLQGTTFIELNVMSAFTWLATGAFLFTSGQLLLASLATIFSSFSLYTGVESFLKKHEASSKK